MTRDRETKPQPQCTDLCKYCMYIESGDFMCCVTHDVTIVDWKPFPCVWPKKRRTQND